MIRKTSETRALAASVVNQKNNSTTDAYSCNYVNGMYKSGTTLLDWTTTSDGQRSLTDNLLNYRMILIMFSQTSGDTGGNAITHFLPSKMFDDYFYGVGNTITGKSFNIYYDYNGAALRCYYLKSENKMRIWGNSIDGYCKIIGYK